MKPSITSTSGEVSLGQKENCITIVTDATRKAAGVAIDELIESGVLNKKNIEKVRARGHELVAAITVLVKEKFAEIAECIVDRVKLISGAERLEIEPTDGTENIYKAKEVFPGYIDSDFKNYGCNVTAKPTDKAPVQVYEMVKDGTFDQIFRGMNENLDQLCLTQHQIKRFVQNHSKWLRTEGYGTFFLFKVDGDFFVAHVRLSSDGLRVCVRRLSGGSVWFAEDRHRVVVPQLALEN